MLEFANGFSASCFPNALASVIVGLASVDALIAVLAFCQLTRIHLRNPQIVWTRQKVFHILIGSSNIGYFVYFVLTLIAACKHWKFWSHFFGFIFMAFPKILLLAAFLLVLSYWVDLCHQASDDGDEEDSTIVQEPLLDKTSDKQSSLSTDARRRCFPFRFVHVGSRQKIVVLVTLLILFLMIASAVIIWIGRGKNPIDSLLVARVYVNLFAITMLILGGALACYGILLCLKLRRVRSEQVSTEMWKVAGLAAVSVLSFTSSAFITIFSDIPLLFHWFQRHFDDVSTALLIIVYYFIGSTVPSAIVLWVMREMPPSVTANVQSESRIITFVRESSVETHQPQRWAMTTSLQNQASKASPI